TKPVVIGQKSISGKDIFVYQPVNLTPEDLLMALRQVGEGLKATPGAKASVETAVHTAEIIKDTRSLLFVAEPEAITIIKDLLASLDTVETTPSLSARATQVFAYSPQYTSHTEIQAALKRLVSTLDPKSIPDLNLTKAIETMEWNRETQSFIITGDASTVERFKTILTSLDGPEQLVGKAAQGFFLYKLQNMEGSSVLAELKTIARQLPQNNVQNQNIAASIDNIQWIENTNALLITGPAYAIERIQTLIADLDIPLAMASRRVADKSSFLIYKPKQRAPEGMLKAIPEMNQNLQDSGLIDPQLFAALSSMTYTPDTDSFIFTGSPEVLKKVEDIVQQIDVGSCASQIQCLGPAT
ncbi:MAG: hypothetical protein JST18_11825, partial [Bacteroidetes bacterium]|nr:hypothetical protein [Bacteroidota bacterium]